MKNATILSKHNLKSYNTFAIDVDAQHFCEIFSIQQCVEILPRLYPYQLPIFILGGGSNILFAHNYPGIVVKVSIPGIDVVFEDKNTVDLKVGAGENWHQFVLYCLERNYGGVENLSLIPGQVGAAPIQNIGAYGVELKDIFVSLSAIDLKSSETKVFTHDECEFGYRDSIFKREAKNCYLITDVTLRLSKKPQVNLDYRGLRELLAKMKIDQPSIKEVSQAVIQIRQQKLPDPKVVGNAGSFFKNPLVSLLHYQQLQTEYPEIPGFAVNENTRKLAAAWLIEQCGYKGKCINQIGVHDKQALVLVNHGGGDGESLLALAAGIQQSVLAKFQIQLEMEVNVVG